MKTLSETARLKTVALSFLLSSAVALGANAGIIGPPPGGGPTDLTQIGARASSSTALCPSFCTSFESDPTAGGLGSLTASSSFSDGRGNAAAQATLDASSGLSLPLLKAEAYVTGSGNSSGFGTAFTVEGYTYDGVVAKVFDLDISLSGVVSDSTPEDGDTDIRADIYIFDGPGFEFYQDIGTLIFEVGAVPLDSVILSLGDGDTLDQGSLSFTAEPGQSFFLWAQLSADAERDLSFADSFSTLTTGFQDPGGLTSASGGTIVPEPGPFALVTLGLVGLARARRQQS